MTSFSLPRDKRGASSVEHVSMIALVALVALAAFARLGGATFDEVLCAARAIGASASGGCRAGAAPAARSEGAAASRDEVAGANGALGYEGSVEVALSALRRRFEDIGGRDGTISDADLHAALSSGDPVLAEAARPFVESSSLAHALDVGQGVGGMDARASAADVAALERAVADGSLRARLADTAAGRGGADGRYSEDDLAALRSDGALPTDVREWAARAEPTTDGGGGCGLNPLCHASHAWSASKSTLASINRVRERIGWIAQLGPPLDPRKWDDWASFRAGLARGAADFAIGTGVGLYRAARWVVTDGNLRELRGVTPRAIWSTGKAFVEGVARDAHACVFAPGYEGGHACGTLAMDAATALVPGGVAMKGTRVARVAGEAGAVDTAGGLSSATSGSLSGSIGRFQSRRTIRSGGEAYRARVSEIAATKYADLPPDVAAIVAEHEMLSVELGVETFQWARPLDADAILRLESETLAMRRHHNNLNGYAAHIDDELSLAILRADLSRNAAFELEAASVPSTARAATAGSRRARNYGETRTSTYPRAMRSRLSRAEPVPVPRVLSGTERDLLEGMLATPGTDVAAAQEIAQRIALVPGSYRLSSQGVRILLDETDQMSVFYHGTTRTLAIHPSFFPAWYDGMVASGAKKLADEQLRDWVRSIVHDTSPR